MELSFEQQAAVDSNAPCILLSATAGSGKSTTLVQRVVRLVRDGVPAAKIAMVTFTTKAAEEMAHKLQPHGIKAGFIGTTHSFCLGILRENVKLLNLPAHLSVVDDTMREQVLLECEQEQKYKGTRIAVEQVLLKGPYQKQPLVVTKQYSVAKAYWQKMREGGLLDFEMILHCAVEALKRGAKPPFLHCLIDESQDTSDLDAEVYLNLGIGCMFYCGDLRQKVYSFRGATGAILSLATGAQVLHLTGNRRCGSSIVEASNRLIAHDDAQHVPAVSLTGTTGSVTVAQFKSDREELDAIAGVLLKNCQSEEQFSDCAVLLRYNALVTRFADGLRARGIPVAAKQQSTVPKDWALATALVSFVGNPENDRLCLTYVEASKGRERALRAKVNAVVNLTSVAFECGVDASYPNFKLQALPSILSDCGISTESQSLLLPLLAHCSTPNELLLAAHEAVQQDEVQGAGVVVCTLHSAKGREFGTCILPAFEETILPGSNEASVHEDRRLAYVGFTRAKERLLLTHCAERQKMYGFGAEAMERSRFLKEVNL